MSKVQIRFRTVIGYKVDEKAMFYKRKSGQDLMQTADDIMELGLKLMEKYRFDKAIPIKIDDSGLGGGVTDRLRRVKREQPERFWWMDIIPVYFGQRIHHDFYYDSTTYMMSVVKNLLAPQTPEGAQKPVQLILPNDNDLVGQLSTRKYSMTDDAIMRCIQGTPILNLMIDAQSGTAGVETRVESFVDILRFQQKGGYVHA